MLEACVKKKMVRTGLGFTVESKYFIGLYLKTELKKQTQNTK